MKTGIYAITSPSGKAYIGSAVDVAKRWRVHRSKLARGVHPNSALQAAYAKYGADRLVYSVLELCAPENLIVREQWYIDARPRRMLYNARMLAHSNFGLKASAETRAKLSKARKGIPCSPERKAAIIAGHEASSYVKTADHRENHAATLRGRKHSEAHKAAISDGLRGHAISEATKALIGAANSRATNTSGFKGVSFSKPHGRWAAYTYTNGKKKHIGLYATAALADEARSAYLKDSVNG